MSSSNLTRSAALILFGVCLQSAPAQNPSAPPSTTIPARSETMVVLGSAAPVPLAESPRSVVVLPLKEKTLAAETPLDFLRQDSSIFLEQRGAGGAQSDLVLRGGSFEQTLILLNGFRINDSQTSHHNLDLPVPLEAMDSIQVLEGAGSTLHGVDALSGALKPWTPSRFSKAPAPRCTVSTRSPALSSSSPPRPTTTRCSFAPLKAASSRTKSLCLPAQREAAGVAAQLPAAIFPPASWPIAITATKMPLPRTGLARTSG